ncbi:hypothetical protein BVRB_2g039720 [Beta vulgaris subsp. vulgaris]|nr:hypothetical protein BVRB_2g039720 [Beta vulgaris subsp. vulgaris]
MERFIRPVIGLKNKIVLEEDRRQVTPLLHLQEYLFCLIWTEGPLDDGSQSLHLTILCVFLGNCPASAAPSHLMAHVVACFCDWINCLICLESAHLIDKDNVILEEKGEEEQLGTPGNTLTVPMTSPPVPKKKETQKLSVPQGTGPVPTSVSSGFAGFIGLSGFGADTKKDEYIKDLEASVS